MAGVAPCKKHTRYYGIRPPRVQCWACVDFYLQEERRRKRRG